MKADKLAALCLASLEVLFIWILKIAKLSVQRTAQLFCKVLILLAKLALALVKVCMRCIDGGIDNIIVKTRHTRLPADLATERRALSCLLHINNTPSPRVEVFKDISPDITEASWIGVR